MEPALPINPGYADGAHSLSRPAVGCPRDAIGQPPSGGVPFGTKRTPDTVVADPSAPDVEP